MQKSGGGDRRGCERGNRLCPGGVVEGDRMIMVQRLRLMVQQCTLNIITTRDLYDIISNKMANGIG